MGAKIAATDKPVSVKLGPLKRRARLVAAAHDLSLSEYIRQRLEKAVTKDEAALKAA